MNKKRPVNLQLTAFKFPIMAISSIGHRITGVILAISIPIMLCLFQKSLTSAQSFADLQTALASPLYKLMLWVIVSSLLYHIVAGIRHLLMDMGLGETLAGGRCGAKLVMLTSLVLIILAGVWIW